MGEFYSVKVLRLHTFGDHLELVFCFAIYLMILMVGGEIGDGFSLATFGIIVTNETLLRLAANGP